MIVVEVILLAVGSGITADLVLRTELPLHWLLCATLVGVVLEPTLDPNFGPPFFHYSPPASTGAAARRGPIGFAAVDLLICWKQPRCLAPIRLLPYDVESEGSTSSKRSNLYRTTFGSTMGLAT